MCGEERYHCLPKLNVSWRLFSLKCSTFPLNIIAAKKKQRLWKEGHPNFSNFITTGARTHMTLIPHLYIEQGACTSFEVDQKYHPLHYTSATPLLQWCDRADVH